VDHRSLPDFPATTRTLQPVLHMLQEQPEDRLKAYWNFDFIFALKVTAVKPMLLERVPGSVYFRPPRCAVNCGSDGYGAMLALRERRPLAIWE